MEPKALSTYKNTASISAKRQARKWYFAHQPNLEEADSYIKVLAVAEAKNKSMTYARKYPSRLVCRTSYANSSSSQTPFTSQEDLHQPPLLRRQQVINPPAQQHYKVPKKGERKYLL